MSVCHLDIPPRLHRNKTIVHANWFQEVGRRELRPGRKINSLSGYDPLLSPLDVGDNYFGALALDSKFNS